MLFYPHNQFAGGGVVERAVSSSVAVSSSFINNSTTSGLSFLALNITGSPGANGSNASPIVGPKGATGNQGPAGPRGLNIWILSSSWTTASCWASGGPGATCYPILMYKRSRDDSNPCTAISAPTVYTTVPDITQQLLVQDISPVYSDSNCTLPVLNDPIIGVNGSTIYKTTVAGTASFSGSCQGNVS